MTREKFTQLVRKELSGLRRFLLAACSGNSDEEDFMARLNEQMDAVDTKQQPRIIPLYRKWLPWAAGIAAVIAIAVLFDKGQTEEPPTEAHIQTQLPDYYSSARQCYHKENHVLDKDTVLYALGLDVLDGEKMELEGVGVNEYYMAQYKAARAATMKYRADKETTSATIDYITREETGKEEEPFDMTPVLDYIKKAVAATDSVQVYETSYECSAEDWDTANALWLITGKDRSRDGITKGHLYVFPKAESQHIQYELTAYVKDNYLNKHTRCNQKFCLRMYHVFTGDMLVLLPSPLMTADIKSNLLYSGLSEDGKFHILIIDEVDGAFLLPSGWKHIIRFQDHKPEYIPGTENREFWD